VEHQLVDALVIEVALVVQLLLGIALLAVLLLHYSQLFR
jgi:hypothetical protein